MSILIGVDVSPILEVDPLILHFDGGCNPNPGGRMTYGWIISTPEGTVRTKGSGSPGSRYPREVYPATNNTAEYVALIEGLGQIGRFLLAGWVGPLLIRGDSQLVIYTVSGKWRAKKPHLKKLRNEAQRLLSVVSSWEILWIPREDNEECDMLGKAHRRIGTSE